MTFTILIALLAVVAMGIILKSWLLPVRGKATIVQLTGNGNRARRHPTIDRGNG